MIVSLSSVFDRFDNLYLFFFYFLASMNYSGGNYVEVLTTLCSLSEELSMTHRVKALHCHLFGMTLSKLVSFLGFVVTGNLYYSLL
jgi:hypothetical protein